MKQMRRIGALFLVGLLVMFVLAACGEVTPTEEVLTAEDYFKRGNDFIQNGKLEEAVGEYQKTLELEPENVDALTNLGVVYYNLGQLDEAIAQYSKAIEIAPNDADIHSNLAAAYVQTVQLEKALDEYSTAVDLNPDLAEAYFGLGVVYMQLGQNDKAIEAFERFQELDMAKDPKDKDPMASSQAEQYLEQLKGQ